MKTNSDKYIIGLLAVAIVVSLMGTVINLDKLGLIGITGLATDSATGTMNLSITSQTELTNRNTSIDWGTGYVNSSHTNCTLDTNGTGSGVDCVSFTNLTAGFLLENTGNFNISVNYTSDNISSTFIGGSNPDPEFQLMVVSNNAASQGDDSITDTSASCNGVGGWNITTYTDILVAGDWLCGNSTHYPLSPSNDRDAGVVDIKVLIPSNAVQGEKGALLTFSATSSG